MSSTYRTALACALAAVSFAVARGGEPVARFPFAVDLDKGEEREIGERIEWFERTRGLDRQSDARERRAAAVGHLRDAVARGRPALLSSEVWQSLGPDSMNMLDWTMGRVSGRVTALAVNPGDENELFVGAAAGGLWKSADGGSSWTQLFDAIGTQSIGSILLENGAPDHVWVGTGEAFAGCVDYFGMGLFYSTDGGATFETRNGSGDTAMPLSFVTAIAQSPADANVLVVGGQGHCNGAGALGNGGLYRTADGGRTWTKVFAASGSLDVFFDRNDATIAYAAIRSKGVYKSIDAGVTWTQLSNGIPINAAATYTRIAIAPSDSSVLYALTGTSATLKLYRSPDAGASWSMVNDDACEGQCSYNLTVDVHPTNPDQVLVGTIRPALSTDGGVTLNILTAGWSSRQAVHQDTHVVRYSQNDGNRFWVGSDGGLWRSDDSGGTFANLNANLEITQFYDVAIDPHNPDRVYGGAQDNSSSRRDEEEQDWGVTAITGDGFMNAVDATSPNRVFQTSYPNAQGASLILSTDRGEPDSYAGVNPSGFDASEPFAWVTPLATAAGSIFVGSNRIYRAPIGDDADAYQWQSISDHLTTSTISVIAPGAFARGDVPVYVGTANGKIWKTDTALAAAPVWQDITGSYPGGNVSDIAVDTRDSAHVFVTRSVFASPHLLRFSAGDWVAAGDGLPALPANAVAIDPLNPQRIFVGTDIGMYASADDGATFEPLMAGLPLGMVVTDLEISAEPHVLVAATYGRGAWKIVLEGSDVIFRNGFESDVTR